MLKVAFRNIKRNKRRTILSLIIIVISIAVLYLVSGYVQDTYQGLKYMEINKNGHLQIAADGFWNNDERLLTVDEINKIENILKDEDNIKSYSSTLEVSGLLGTEEDSTPIIGVGIEPEKNNSVMINSGTKLFAGDKNRILVGEGIKDKLGLTVDEWVSIMALTPAGAYNALSFKVSGSFSSGFEEMDQRFIYLPLNSAQNLLDTKGVDKYKITLKENAKLKETINLLENKFASKGLDLGIKSWRDLADYYYQIKGMYNMVFIFMAFIITILVFFSIFEIMSMSFFERMNELGTIRAIGTTKSQLFGQLLIEAIILGIIGGIIGIISGFGSANLINSLNITYTPPNISEAVPLSIKNSLSNAILPFLLVLTVTGFSALLPAFKAARLNIVETLRHV